MALKSVNCKLNNNPMNETDLPIYRHEKNNLYVLTNNKSKFYYRNLIGQKAQIPISEFYWQMKTDNQFTQKQFKASCKCKISCIHDKKLSETNFKILQNILPCNANLFRWKKINTNNCALCANVESVSHLIYECSYAKEIWRDVEIALDIVTSLNMVIFGINKDQTLNTILSIIVYIIYKDWLICSLENNSRSDRPCINSIINELNVRHEIYYRCKHKSWKNVCEKLNVLIKYLKNIAINTPNDH